MPEDRPRVTDFRPARWLPGAHLQTLWAPLTRRLKAPPRERERLWLDDGDFIDLDWCGPHEANAPLVLALHGLTGSSSSHYILGLQRQLMLRGWASVAINWRGCSGEPNLQPRAYHSGASDDLASVVAHLRAKRPLAPLFAVGYSLGGNVLLKHLGEQGPAAQLQGAVAVSVPFRLDRCADHLDRGFSRVYQAHFMRAMLAYLRDKQRLFSHQGMADQLSVLDRLGPLDGIRTFWDFDGRVTAPLHGFADAADYYRRASSSFYLDGIRVPTLLIQAEDDPFIATDCLPATGQLSATTRFERHRHGGHVGFIGGTPWQPRYYLEHRIPDWLSTQWARTA